MTVDGTRDILGVRASAGDIACLLGYERPDSCYPAFRSWTGLTPSRISADR
ncbi:helix-turn-helix domain-containing protein [Streptomyces marianii]|uniref:Helix-turn-helix transcriptional regulator n=1 Tax=Streptomyces marianii TaxID=1817406 RepID=A0A5R9DZ55_9ACTN|nr:AraC family transcriptional regulator [Streptomyces marianii]TLQ42045.1 helix-turn-helix transcriptional regulator [Streptomyces marianii]